MKEKPCVAMHKGCCTLLEVGKSYTQRNLAGMRDY